MEEEQSKSFEKPFDLVSIVIMALLVVPDGIFKIIGLLGVETVVLTVIAEIYSIVVYSIIIFWFVMKLGVFGTAGLVITTGGVLDLFQVPLSLALAVFIAIYLANHPKVAAVASVATGKPGAAAAKTEVAAAEKVAVTAEKTGAAAEKEAVSGAEGAAPKGKPSEAGGAQVKPEEETKPEVSKEAFGEEPTEFEKLERLTKEVPQAERGEEDEGEEEESLPRAA